MSEESNDSLAVRAQQRSANLANIEQSIVTTDAAGNTGIVITDELRAKFNVLAPSGVFMQENPSIKPMLAIVQLNDEDYYDIDKTHKAPDKNGLSKIRDARGISFPAALNSGEFGVREQFTVEYEGRSRTLGFRTYKYTAVGVLRDADGSLKEFPAEVDFDPQVALIDAELDVKRRTKNWGKKPTDSEMFDLILERFKELVKYAAPMVKSKAQNAAIRTAAKVPQKFATVDAKKPFLLVNYVFQSDSEDARAALMQSVFGVSSPAAALYGPEATPAALAPAPVEEEVTQTEDDDVPEAVYEDSIIDAEYTVDDGREVNTATGEFTDAPESAESVAARTFVCEPEHIAPAAPKFSDVERAEFAELMGYVLPASDQKGKTLKEVLASEGAKWFQSAADFFIAKRSTLEDDGMIAMLETLTTFNDFLKRSGQ